MAVKIKVCGITNLEDALLAAELGVDALGFIFACDSPRAVNPQVAKKIIAELPPFITTVGVFVNDSKEYIQQIRHFCYLDMVQLHGGESPGFCRRLGGRIIKALRVKDEDSISGLQDYPLDNFLLDAYKEGQAGGTGETFDWRLALAAKRYGRVILSGGLNPRNVARAIQQVRPYAVDVASGVEAAPGKKDGRLLAEFVKVVKNVSLNGSGEDDGSQ